MATRVLETGSPGIHRIGRYDLVAELASGGMATVYLARLSGVGGFQRNVAIKVLHPHLAYDAEFVEMFLDEARLAAMIHHPNVVPIQEVDEGEHGYYLVMDYVEGDTFAALLSRAAAMGQPVPREVVLRITLEMLAGLHAAHELCDEHGSLIGVVHRDVSPQNVLVGTDGMTRLTDFGVARAASRLSATRNGQLKGKLAYMAPEQATGDDALDRRADVFSAGVVLWEALALRRLFKASNEAATLSRVMSEPIRSPADFNPSVPPSIAQVCLYALSRDVNGRYATAAQFAEALEMAAQQTGPIATNRDVAAYVAQVVGADVEAHRAAIRQWLEKRDALGSSFIGAAAAAQVPVLPLRSAPFSDSSQTFSSWSISGYPGMRSGSSRPFARNAHLGSSRPPAMDASSVGAVSAVAYKPIPGYGSNGLPLPPAARPTSAVSGSVPPMPSRSPSQAPGRRWVMAGGVAAAAVVLGLGLAFFGRSNPEAEQSTAVAPALPPAVSASTLAARTTPPEVSQQSLPAASLADPAGGPTSVPPNSSPPVAAPSAGSSPIPAQSPRPAPLMSPAQKPQPVTRPSPKPSPKPARRRNIPDLDNPYQ